MLITGSSQGIGRASAQTFAAAGAHVVACARSRQPLFSFAESQRAHGYHVVSRIADIASGPDAKRVVAFALQQYGRLDVVINNAGYPLAVRSAHPSSDNGLAAGT